MNARLVFSSALVLALLLPFTISAQAKKDQEKKASGSITITGCLNKGAAPDQYVIKDQKTGNETAVTGEAKLLSPHASHEVTLTGTMTKDKEGKEVLRATDLKMIAPRCQ